MSNKKHYYETAHFFDHHCPYYNVVLRVLSLAAWNGTNTSKKSNCSCGVRGYLPAGIPVIPFGKKNCSTVIVCSKK
jgi:hypothetical protein